MICKSQVLVRQEIDLLLEIKRKTSQTKWNAKTSIQDVVLQASASSYEGSCTETDGSVHI